MTSTFVLLFHLLLMHSMVAKIVLTPQERCCCCTWCKCLKSCVLIGFAWKAARWIWWLWPSISHYFASYYNRNVTANSGKDVAPFLWLTGAATSSHAAAPALYQEDLNFWFKTKQTKSIYDGKNLQHSPPWSAKNCPDEKVWDSNLDKIFVSWG